MRHAIALGLAAALLAATAAHPQTSTPVTPGAGIPPASGGAADRTGSIAATGQTKPPGAPVGEGRGTSAELERKSEEVDRLVKNGICKGC